MSRTKQRRIEHWTRATLLTLFVGAPLAAAQEHATPSERPRAAFEGPRHSEGAVHVEDLGRRLEQLERRIADVQTRAADRQWEQPGAERMWTERGGRSRAGAEPLGARVRERFGRGIGRSQGSERAPRTFEDRGAGARHHAARGGRGAGASAEDSRAGCDRRTSERGVAGSDRSDARGRRGEFPRRGPQRARPASGEQGRAPRRR